MIQINTVNVIGGSKWWYRLGQWMPEEDLIIKLTDVMQSLRIYAFMHWNLWITNPSYLHTNLGKFQILHATPFLRFELHGNQSGY